MPGTEKLRDVLSGSPTLEYLSEMRAAGWRLVALEWAREVAENVGEPEVRLEEIPYGMQVAMDGCHLMENEAEMRVLTDAVKLIVNDTPVTRVAMELNQLGYRTRRGEIWTPSAVFDLVPRMIEAGPRILGGDEWKLRRNRLVTG